MTPILKGIGRRSGDGWKDVTRIGQVAFVYGRALPRPYSPGQYPRVGCTIWSASEEQFDFRPASLTEIVRLLPEILRDVWRGDLARLAEAHRRAKP